MNEYTPPSIPRVRGELPIPGDKSITHRALILACLAHGKSHLTNLLRAADCQRTASALRSLGASIPVLNRQTAVVHGRGLRGLREPGRVLDCGNSGTTLRLLTGLIAGYEAFAVLTGDGSLCRRPMRRLTVPLREMGAVVDGRQEGQYPPLMVRGGRLRSLAYFSPLPSAQLKSALLLAGIGQDIRVEVREPAPSRNHTELLLRQMGANLDWEPGQVVLVGGKELTPLELSIPGDFSSAAFFLGLAALLPGSELLIPGVGVNPTRTGFIGVLERMGARVQCLNLRENGEEPVADLLVTGGELVGTGVSPEEIPQLVDEVPLLSVMAARARGTTVIAGAEELRVKESDRLAALARNLKTLGVEVEEQPDGLTIQGTARPLRGTVESDGDHRIAMAFAVLGALPGQAMTIRDFGCVAVSFPDFPRLLELLHRHA